MIYEYIDDQTGNKIEREFSMKDDIPSKVEEDGTVYHRYYGSSFIEIPDNFRAMKDRNRPAYGKRSPGEGKRFY